jgi:DNA polymerase-1
MDLFLPRLTADDLMKVFCELEMPKVFILKDIEMNGICVDAEALRKHLAEAPAKLADLEQRMYSLRPNREPFNANSPKQLTQILFHEIGIKPSGEPGKSGLYSTDKANMEMWLNKHPLVEAILEYRNLSKLMGTYLEGLTKRIGPDGRIRTRFNQILTTGRLSSSNPNLQNIPKPEKDTFGLRELFVAGEGKKLVVADYSQIELRVLAHISKDPTFIKAFTDNEDLHAYAAKMLFDLPEPLSEVKEKHKEQRSIGKTFNFAMVYGAGVKKLASSAKVDERKAKELRDKYMNAFMALSGT